MVSAAFCIGFGFGLYDAGNTPFFRRIVSAKYRATAHGLINVDGVFASAFITGRLGKSVVVGDAVKSFAVRSGIVVL